MTTLFSSDVFSAVTYCRSQNAWLLFFVDGGDEAARHVTTALESCSSAFQGKKFVLLSAPASSDLHKQFEVIYGPTPVNTVTFIANRGAGVIRWVDHGNIEDLIHKILLIGSNTDTEHGEFGYPSEDSLRDLMPSNSNDNEAMLPNGSVTPHERLGTETQPSGSTGKKNSQGQPKEVTVLQIRCPDGSSVTKTFTTSSLLSEVRDMIASHFSLSAGFGLATSFPRYHFVSEDYSRHLEELDLWPNAVLLIVPADPREANNISVWRYTASVSSWAYTMIMYVWNRISSFFSFTGRRNSRPETPSSEGRTNAPPGQSVSRRRSNIHTLRDTEKDDDKRRTTYNGNSTQQL